MARNRYISQQVKSEQYLYEDIIVESMKIYGQEVRYIPRTLVNEDAIFGADLVSRFEEQYQIEMYLENIEGFDGEQELFSKFGVEIRDRATLHVSKRRWEQTVGPFVDFTRPREGDLIYLELSNQLFQIAKVVHDQPFYQLSNFPTYKIEIELFEYNDEDFDTDETLIDNVELLGNKLTLTLQESDSDDFVVGETISQTTGGKTVTGEIIGWDAGNNTLQIAHIGGDSSGVIDFAQGTITSSQSGITKTVLNIDSDLQTNFDQTEAFETEGDLIIDFSEDNPFGEVT